MSRSLFWKSLSRMHVFAKRILRSVRKGSLTCKKAALSDVGNAAAWPKPSTATGKGQRKPPSCQEHCMLPLTTVIQSQPLHSASGPSPKSRHPCFCFLHTAYILHFQNHWLRRILSLQMNPAQLTGWENRRLWPQQISAGLKPSSLGAQNTRWVLPALEMSDVVWV